MTWLFQLTMKSVQQNFTCLHDKDCGKTRYISILPEHNKGSVLQTYSPHCTEWVKSRKH